MSFSTLSNLKRAFKQTGCQYLLVKLLADKQDNEKNQIYLGYSKEFLSIFPSQVKMRPPSSSTSKRASSVGSPILEHSFQLFWLVEGKEPARAPKAKIIDYFQYPEMRLSGFLSGCTNPPDALRRDSQDSYGRRVLILGFSGNTVYGTVVTDADCTFVNELLSLPLWLNSNMFYQLVLEENSIDDINPDLLLAELRAIGSQNKYQSQVLRKIGKESEEFRGSQGAGWTLESLLGIPRNSSDLPDKYGFELKAFLSTTITLMTPEPDFGYRHDEGLTAFLYKYGWPGTKNDGSHRFNGRHSTQGTYKKSGLKLAIENWDMETNTPTGLGDPNVLLTNPQTDEIAAGWSFSKLAEKWGRKHAGAMYVSAKKFKLETGSFPSHYSFGPDVYCGQGTSAILLLQAIGLGVVYLDPGDRVSESGEEKRRTQWRISKGRGSNFSSTLAPLYDQMKTFQI
jgi:MvaI/BcnI restriction endonuclease family